MKIAIISDIHSNIYALMRVLEDIDSQNVDSTVCLGDLVGYGSHPNEVISLIRKRNILCIKGNYDSSVIDNGFTYIRDTNINSFSLPWTVEELRIANRYYLENLPDTINLTFGNKDISFVHGSPRKINEYLTPDSESLNDIMDDFNGDILVCAHTHIPYIKEFGNKLLINCGSVGKPKNGSPNSTYAILEVQKNGSPKITLRSVEYEYTKIMKDMEIRKFPLSLIRSYETGIE